MPGCCLPLLTHTRCHHNHHLSQTMIRALESLHALGALDGDARLARPLGAQMADLPLDPVLARMLLAAGQMGCTAEVLTVVAMLR